MNASNSHEAWHRQAPQSSYTFIRAAHTDTTASILPSRSHSARALTASEYCARYEPSPLMASAKHGFCCLDLDQQDIVPVIPQVVWLCLHRSRQQEPSRRVRDEVADRFRGCSGRTTAAPAARDAHETLRLCSADRSSGTHILAD